MIVRIYPRFLKPSKVGWFFVLIAVKNDYLHKKSFY